jgi:hypothetical protein
MYIFDSGAKNEANFRVKLGWVENLPVITGRFGCPTMIEQDSFFSVRSRGSMDDTLLNDYIERVIFPLYPNMAKVAEFDPVTGRLLKGPVLLKLDAGPGRIVASEEIILKRAEYFEKGLTILMGLPNATSVQQEMDALYGPFKTATYARGERVVELKLKERGEAIRNGEPHSAVLSLNFDDLSVIVNGLPDDDVSMQPFNLVFTKNKILKSWDKIGFVPFTRKCVQNPKVRTELGQHEADGTLENLQVKYNSLVEQAELAGLNPGVFNGAIPVARHVARVEDEDEQVKQLLAQKGAFSASALWNICGTRVGNAGVALKAQKAQLALEAAKVAQVALEKDERQAKLLAKAQSAFEKYHMDVNCCKDSEWIDMMKWVLPAAGVKFLVKDFKKKDDIVTKFATLPNVWTSYIPPRGATLENATLEDVPEDAEGVVAEVTPIAAVAEVSTVAEVLGEAMVLAVAAAKAVLAKAARKSRLIDKAQIAFEKYKNDVNALVDSDWVDMMKWVLTAAKKKFRVMDLTTKDLILAKFATLNSDWKSFIPSR